MIARLAAFARPFAAALALSAALRVLQLACGIAILAVAVSAIARIGEASIAATAGLIAVLAVAKGAAHYGEQYLGHWVAFTVLARLRIAFFDALARLSPSVLHQHRSGDLTARATADVNRVEVFYAHTIAPALAAALVLLGSAAYLAVAVHPALAAILLVGAAISGLAVPLLGRHRAGQAARRRQHTRGQIAAHVTDTIAGLRDLTLLRAIGQWQGRLDALDARAAADTHALAARIAGRRAANTAVLAATVCAVALTGAYLWRGGGIGLQAWWTAIAIALAMAPALTAVEAFAAEFGTTLAAARRLFVIIDTPPAAVRAELAPSAGASAGGLYRRAGVAVSMRGVRFAFPGSADNAAPVLDGIDLDLPPGSTTAVLGVTGSGKSSLGYLLAAALTPTEGIITLDGTDLRRIPDDELRRKVALADQRPFVFSGTVASNLRLARPGADEGELWHVLEVVALADTVRALPEQLHTRLTERGANLSGGELQRLSLAQALLRRPALLICDEVTSQLDAATEAQLLERLRRELAGSTTVWITHRPATLHASDQIVVLDGGRIIRGEPPGDRLLR
ncbi:ABC transporter ATP-binding protein [Nonomuraea rubra]|uniref:ABC-type transport system involved in cytochrome bd biosynthesis fused ATPase/permease subunit n=1 Tax=Nonomuraea rubra TaxID=46180 RepID=A0A7X0P0Z4_9ACTN|nr:ABC transporter ATP-binding protein [Nonomuraea rubra]MBB6553284.1 ABC-type transport system involved in cytochrome bd biosynthesis fused ATPase/permease subunit [Nonomuraea rubra]